MPAVPAGQARPPSRTSSIRHHGKTGPVDSRLAFVSAASDARLEGDHHPGRAAPRADPGLRTYLAFRDGAVQATWAPPSPGPPRIPLRFGGGAHAGKKARVISALRAHVERFLGLGSSEPLTGPERRRKAPCGPFELLLELRNELVFQYTGSWMDSRWAWWSVAPGLRLPVEALVGISRSLLLRCFRVEDSRVMGEVDSLVALSAAAQSRSPRRRWGVVRSRRLG